MTPASLMEARRAYRWTAALADTLVDRRRRLDGDLDQYLLYMTVVQAEVERSFSPDRGQAGLNALSLAEICGLARETARTKLRRMTGAGLLALRILGAGDQALRDKLLAYRGAMAEESGKKNQHLQQKLAQA